MLGPDITFWKDRRVLVTGHTGFKGGWLSLWLASMGAETHGMSLPPPAVPNLHDAARVSDALASSTYADIRTPQAIAAVMAKVRPDVVFHLAAQPLVRESYERPVETYEVNVMGVVHLLQAARDSRCVRAVINVTTDKCYDNRDRRTAFREYEPLGGRDPYSSSKACAELVTAAYREAFLSGLGIAVSTVRAGNVIGGGDWARDRLIPDVFRAIMSSTVLRLRFPEAIRPWQHVLEPLSGYLLLAERLYIDGAEFAEAWNFGPTDEDGRTVAWIVDFLRNRHPELSWCPDTSVHPHESQHLKLDSSKARERLGWRPRWPLVTALEETSEWYEAWRQGQNMRDCTLAQIRDYVAA
jgi:CDP-glucose 4,6-dehydratase